MKKILLFLCCIAFLTACSKKSEENTSIDFWQATVQAVERKSDDNSYNEGKWDIGIEISDDSHKSITIREIFQEDNQKIRVMYSLQNQNNKKTISYIYEKTVNNDCYKLNISSTDKAYLNYETIYSVNYKEEAKGQMTVKNNQLSFDTIDMLEEAMTAFITLLDDFQNEFNIDYSQYDFVNLPELSKNADFNSRDINKEIDTSIDYYSDVYYNAKGYTLQDFLKIDKEGNTAQYGVYNLDRKSNDTNETVTLEKRTHENCYNIVQRNDPDNYLAVYFYNDDAYIYLQNISDDKMLDDITNHNAKQARNIFKKSS